MTHTVDVSVIVPAFNAQDTITDCVQSVLANSPAPRECIVVDDASTDQTAQLAEAAGARVIRLATNGGPGLARNRGARAAQAEFLAFTDADCVAPHNWIGTLFQYHADPSIVGVTGPYSGPARPTFFTTLIDRWLRFNQRHVADHIQSCVTSNLFIAKERFFLAGGFPRYRLPGSDKYYFGNEDEEYARLLSHTTGKSFLWLRQHGPYHSYRDSLKTHLKQQRHWAEAIVVSYACFPTVFLNGKTNYSPPSSLLAILLLWLAVVCPLLAITTDAPLLLSGSIPFVGLSWQYSRYIMAQESNFKRKMQYFFATGPFLALTCVAWTLGLCSGVIKALPVVLAWTDKGKVQLPVEVEAE